MKSTLVSASVLALAALAAGSSFAEGNDIYASGKVNAVSTRTRSDVQAELAQAQRNGYNVNIGQNGSGDHATGISSVRTGSSKSRDEVRREAASASVATNAVDRDYPVLR